jgi:lipopolysaccharide/colanic/teichoic acid biosynthesis glycosyltransferase
VALRQPAPPEPVLPRYEVVAEESAWEGASFYERFGKRAFDLVASLILLVVALPVILALAVLVIATSGLPAFYGATRVGKDGKPFRMWKLRTMVRDADAIIEYWKQKGTEEGVIYLQSYKLRNDPRVTPLGRILRKTSLDELPQLLNVLRGDMSLVGPRPYYLSELSEYPDVLEALIQVRPGITGPWQIGGRNEISPRERMAIDQRYVATLSAPGDIKYLLKTVVHLTRVDGL